jgi:hypothetical protein
MVGGISVRILCRQKMLRHVHGHVFWSSCLVVRVSFCHEVHVNPHSTISVSTHILSRNMTASLCRRPSGPKTKRTSVRPPKILLCGQQTQRCVVGSKMWPGVPITQNRPPWPQNKENDALCHGGVSGCPQNDLPGPQPERKGVRHP